MWQNVDIQVEIAGRSSVRTLQTLSGKPELLTRRDPCRDLHADFLRYVALFQGQFFLRTENRFFQSNRQVILDVLIF